MANASFSNWRPYENYVQTGGEGPGMVDGQFVSGAFVGLFAGPPRLATIGGRLSLGAALDSPAAGAQIVYPIGITQNFSIGQNRQISRIFELGSERSYFISGRSMGQVGLSRILYHGPSILRVLYAYYQDTLDPTIISPVFENIGAAANPNPKNVVLPPGYENFYINLASDLFQQPIGLLVIVKDSNQDTFGSFYLESCYIPNHSFATDAQNVIVQESVSLQFELAVPISSQTIELID
jgi:hypothetical protein